MGFVSKGSFTVLGLTRKLRALKGALQLLMNRYMGKSDLLRLPERDSTKGFVVLSLRNSTSNHLGAQGTFKTTIFMHATLVGGGGTARGLWPRAGFGFQVSGLRVNPTPNPNRRRRRRAFSRWL